MAYNPAAPAAPEQIRHREKTPPPPEDDGLDPLHAAVARDHQPQSVPYTPGFSGGGPMSPTYSIGVGGPMSPGFGGHHPTATGPMTPGFPPTATGPISPGFPPAPSGAPASRPRIRPRLAGPPEPEPLRRVPGLSQLRASPAPFVLGPSRLDEHARESVVAAAPAGRVRQLQLHAHEPALGGGGATDYSIHSQVYRPTEQEAIHHKHDSSGSYRPRSGEERSKLGQNADRLERGVTGMFKKLEKKLL
ncbi:hypothetical protein PG997_010229 [Apiospora hydei]|uniref:Uncharacterized protein n=1 Tax=Apiospora hydei TaxID=1337664 RepID=A0ABR1VWF1_9PEZI